MITEELKQETLKLNPVEKVKLVELILKSLDEIDPVVENAWVAESEARYGDFKSGKLDSVSLSSVRKSLNK
ncbi:MAG TPA: addiction module protein [Clostridiales bacterium]|nr:addiction module protein [Clostridiales bacterium]HQP70103.1 addiction module protein [Clostridiales bacterium]